MRRQTATNILRRNQNGKTQKNHHKSKSDAKGETPPTEKKAKHEFNSLIHGKHDDKLVIENIRPKLTGGKRKIIDETFRDSEIYKETKEGEFKE